MRVAVIGGGINGAGIAWELVRRDYAVTLFEKKSFGGATSSATTKLIHGGLRYLEGFHLGLVRESLRERAFLVQHLPDLVKPIEIVLPVYRGVSRPAWMIEIGLTLYDFLAGRDGIRNHRRLSPAQIRDYRTLRQEHLAGGFVFSDAQVDDHALVGRVIAAARRDGLDAREGHSVNALRAREGGWTVETNSGAEVFDLAVLALGPWMNEFLTAQRIPTSYALSLIRGSHLILDRRISDQGFLLQSPGENRVFFVLPWKETTLVGTTEVPHDGSLDDVAASPQEVSYLLGRFNHYFDPDISEANVVRTFAGVRPLVGLKDDLSKISREYRIEAGRRMIKVFGGKMTTFLSLARKVGRAVEGQLGRRSQPAPPRF